MGEPLNYAIIFLSLVIFVVYKRTRSYVSLNGLAMILLFSLLVYLKLRIQPNLETLGFRIDNFGDTIVPLVVLNVVGVVIVFSSGFKRNKFKSLGWLITLVVLYFAFGIVQQIFFQSIITDTLFKVIRNHNLTILASGMVCAAFHWSRDVKKVSLAFFTLIAGMVWATLYLKSPNIYLLGLSHAILASLYYFRIRGDNVLQLRLSNKKRRVS